MMIKQSLKVDTKRPLTFPPVVRIGRYLGPFNLWGRRNPPFGSLQNEQVVKKILILRLRGVTCEGDVERPSHRLPE